MIVTAFYDIYNKPENFSKYFDLFYKIGNSNLPIILFTQPEFVEKFKVFPSVYTIGMDLNEFELYSLCINSNYDLPEIKNINKDTKEFLALMNSKIEFVLNASKISTDDVFIWVDFGILKIINDIDKFITKLKLINEKQFNKIIIPGCWPKGFSFSFNTVNWRFCGGVIIIPKHHIESFYNISKKMLKNEYNIPHFKLTWETNMWNLIEQIYYKNDEIQWYLADHNDSILFDI
jgi:hypothetical protein